MDYNKKTDNYQTKKYKYSKSNKKLMMSCLIVFLAVLIGLLGDVLKGRSSMEAWTTETVQGIETSAGPEDLTIHYIDVGHGDSTLLTCGGMTMLIDCGDDTQGTKIQYYLKQRGIEKLDYLILTHPDKDHVGGAPVILTKFGIDTMFMSYYEKDNYTYDKLMDTIAYYGQEWSTPQVGDTYSFGSAFFTIVAPNDIYEDSNDTSIAVLVNNGENKFLFTGDAEKKAEFDMLENGYDLQADVLHVGHHGSNSSSKKKFLKAVNPTYAVISCEYNGEEGHPHVEVLERLRERDIKVFRTDEQGTIVSVSNGKEIAWSTTPSETWRDGEPGAK